MKNSIFADIRRVRKKKSFILMLIIQCVLIICGFVIYRLVSPDGNLSEQYKMMTGAMMGMANLLLGLPIFLAVFSDDFRSHAMQTAIGYGLSRNKLIYARFFETLALLIEVTLVMDIVAIGTGLIYGVPFDTVWYVISNNWIDLLPTLGYLSICMIPAYGMQSATFAMVLYILFIVDIPGAMLNAVTAFVPGMRNTHLDWIIPEHLIMEVGKSGNYSWGWIVWILIPLVYIVLPVWLATLVFRKKELEF